MPVSRLDMEPIHVICGLYIVRCGDTGRCLRCADRMSLPDVGEIVVVTAVLEVLCLVKGWEGGIRGNSYLYWICRAVAMAAGAERRVRVVVLERVEVLVAATAGAVVSWFLG